MTTVYISGGASGLGAATAERLAATGARVGILDLDTNRGEPLADRLDGAFAHCNVGMRMTPSQTVTSPGGPAT